MEAVVQAVIYLWQDSDSVFFREVVSHSDDGSSTLLSLTSDGAR